MHRRCQEHTADRSADSSKMLARIAAVLQLPVPPTPARLRWSDSRHPGKIRRGRCRARSGCSINLGRVDAPRRSRFDSRRVPALPAHGVRHAGSRKEAKTCTSEGYASSRPASRRGPARLAIAGCVLVAVPLAWTVRQSWLTDRALDGRRRRGEVGGAGPDGRRAGTGPDPGRGEAPEGPGRQAVAPR